MTPPDTEGVTLFAKIVSTGGPIVALLVAPVIWVETRLRSKSDKKDTRESIRDCLEQIKELSKSANEDRKVANEDRKLMRDLHDTAMRSFNESHRELMNLLLQHLNHNGAKQ